MSALNRYYSYENSRKKSNYEQQMEMAFAKVDGYAFQEKKP